MEEETRTEEPFLKIERTWSEAEQNFENITVKEEDISDVEPETLLNVTEENNCSFITPTNSIGTQNDEGTKINSDEGSLSQIDGDGRKRGKSKGSDFHPSCLHNAKNFKVVKKRLRCNDCKSILCPECYCTISSSLQTHFSKSDNNNKKLYPCKLCSMIFKANCALQAHIRIHLLDTPYVCPDCGAIYNNIYFLSLHLINKCYHVYKVVSNGCKFCLSQNMSPEDYISHIEKSHIKPVYKCSQCSLIFENTTDMNRHLGSSHKNESVMSLSYFSCSMCGNLKISKHLYAKHLKYHRDHTAAFQIGYLCSCGHSFNTACSFRTHFKNCSKKGILPPQWTYLQVTLKTQEMLQVQSAIQKSTFIQSGSGTISGSSDSKTDAEKKQLDYSLFEDGDSSEDLEEPSEESSMNSSNDCESGKAKIDEENGKGAETDKTLSVTENGTKVSKEIQKIQDCNAENRGERYNVKCQEEVVEIVREPEKNDIQTDTQNANNLILSLEHDKGVENGDKTLKVVYDHIPCDHLGYLKTQQSSQLRDKNVKRDGIESGKNGEFSENVSGSDNYIITSVLDEKTGLMRTRKVFIQKNHTEQTEADESCELAAADSQNNDLQKSRSGTFFSCPFCSVLFPKHFSSFHRFRLHLEFYHPDAALNITVDRSQLPKSQTPFSSINVQENDFESECDGDLDDVDLQTRLNNLKESNKDDSGNFNLQTSESSNDGSFQNDSSGRDKKKKGAHMRQMERNDFDMRLRSGKSVELGNGEDVRLKSNPKDKKSSFSKKIKENFRTAVSQSVDQFRGTGYAEDSGEKTGHRLVTGRNLEDFDENSESMDSEICSSYNRATKVKEDCDNDSESKDGNLLKKITPRELRISEDSLSDDRGGNDFHDYVDDKEHLKKQEGVGSKIGRTKHQRTDDEMYEDEKPECIKEEKGGRCGERKNSKRESDVWSEFYKTLKIAETLKKTKVKNRENEDAPILKNYANKRIVKKPKRYRESSDSEESNDGESNRFDAEEDDLYTKKKKLMSRLENVDYRILDYVFKILERKQKNTAFIKKSAEAKGFNTRLMIGGKMMGRTQKAHAEDGIQEEEKEILDYNGEELDGDPQTGTSTEDRVDKKRGRPRKSDTLTLKDRKRFDYHKEGNLDGGDEDDFNGKKKKRKLSNKLQYFKKMLEKKDFSSGQVITTVKSSDPEKKLTCAVCKESHQNEAEFREHIQTHKMDESSHQCMECGECFVVRPSLEKHLHAFHKIKNVQKYIEENECCSPDGQEDADSEPLKENQCKVCKDQFPTIHDLNKHFRIHGMAFLRQYKKDPKTNG